jgi:hypothetical protein
VVGVVVGAVVPVVFVVALAAPVPVATVAPAGPVTGVLPEVQLTALELAGAPSAVPKKLVDSAKGLPLVLASPAYTRTTMRFMVVMLVSK